MPLLRGYLHKGKEAIIDSPFGLLNDTPVDIAPHIGFGDIVELGDILHRSVDFQVLLNGLADGFYLLHGAEVVVHLMLIVSEDFRQVCLCVHWRRNV